MADKTMTFEIDSNIKSVTKDVEKLDKATDKASGGFKKMGTAVKGIGTALKAAGIGLVVALLAKLGEVFSKNQKVLDTFNTAMTALSIAFNDLFSFIDNNIGTITGYFKELFENPKEKIIELGKAIGLSILESSTPLVLYWIKLSGISTSQSLVRDNRIILLLLRISNSTFKYFSLRRDINTCCILCFWFARTISYS